MFFLVQSPCHKNKLVEIQHPGFKHVQTIQCREAAMNLSNKNKTSSSIFQPHQIAIGSVCMVYICFAINTINKNPGQLCQHQSTLRIRHQIAPPRPKIAQSFDPPSRNLRAHRHRIFPQLPGDDLLRRWRCLQGVVSRMGPPRGPRDRSCVF